MKTSTGAKALTIISVVLSVIGLILIAVLFDSLGILDSLMNSSDVSGGAALISLFGLFINSMMSVWLIGIVLTVIAAIWAVYGIVIFMMWLYKKNSTAFTVVAISGIVVFGIIFINAGIGAAVHIGDMMLGDTLETMLSSI